MGKEIIELQSICEQHSIPAFTKNPSDEQDESIDNRTSGCGGFIRANTSNLSNIP